MHLLLWINLNVMFAFFCTSSAELLGTGEASKKFKMKIYVSSRIRTSNLAYILLFILPHVTMPVKIAGFLCPRPERSAGGI